jgi:type I restriction enzyme S subunit
MNVKTSLEMSKDISKPEQLITEHIDIWTSAILAKSTSGRGSSKKYELYGISKLRELILELAVRGKLVPQDASDEPASVLLERIAAEKALLIKKGEIKKAKLLPELTEDEKPFESPQGWCFYRLGDLVKKLGSGSTPRGGKNAYVSEGIPFLRSQNVRNEGLDDSDIAYISSETHQRMNNTIVYPGDILLNITGASLGRSIIFPNTYPEANVSQHVTIIRMIDPNITPFIYLCICSPLLQKIVWERQVGMAIEGLSKKVLELFEIPIPPLAEQKRIVAKVDELMLLCDQLEQQTEAIIDAHATLVEVLLATLTDSADADELAQNWSRISEHFDSLFTTEQSIDALKQTVLQLAVMGQLVPQNPDDEPASVLLEKERLIRESKIKQPSSWLEITENEKPFESPESWIWLRFGDVYPLEYGNNLPKPKRSNTGEYNVYGSNGIVGSHNAACVKSSCIVVGRKGSAGALNISLDDGCWVTDVAYSCIPIKGIDLYFAFMHLKTLGLDSLGKGIKPGLNRNEAYSLPVAIPPLSEQHLIVAKVDELMAICDQLKEKLQQSQETQVQLTDALVDRALE